MKLSTLIQKFINWLNKPIKDERKASVRYQQADKAAREQVELIKQKQ